MKIVVDINHPKDILFFKNFIWQMEKKGHIIQITASKKDVSYTLLRNYGFKFISLGSYGVSLFDKLINIFNLDYKMLLAIKNFHPDMFLGFGSIRAAHISFLLRKPCINLDDSEPSPQEHLLYVPFSKYILTPMSFKKNLGKKQIRFNGYIELAYLHPNYFKPNPTVLDQLGLKVGERYSVVRFVSWSASHDIGRYGINNNEKEILIKKLEKYGPVFISSEKTINSFLDKYRLKIRPDYLHDLLYYSSLFVGDGQTMATEAALLGVPAIRCNSFVGENDMSNFIDLEKKYGLMYNFADFNQVINKIDYLFSQSNLKNQWLKKRDKLLRDKIDVTQYLINFIEKYPNIC